MSQPAAGSRRNGLFSRDDYLAPPHIPTGQPPKDVLNTIWRKNNVFLDIGDYSIGSAMMVIWPVFLIFVFAIYNERNAGEYFWWMLLLAFFMVGIPILILLHSLIQPVPPRTLQPPAP